MSQSASSSSLNSIETRPYHCEGGFSASGLAFMTVAGVIVAVVCGVLASFIGLFLYLVLVFPVLIGAAVGATQAWAIQNSKIRSPLACGAAGLVAGALAVVTIHYTDYLMLREGPKLIGEYLPAFAIPEANEFDSFPSYIDWSAREGVEIVSTRGNARLFKFGYVGSYVYWGAEMFIVALIAACMAGIRACAPYCSQCDTWKVSRELGSVQARAKDVTAIVESGRLDELANVPHSPNHETAVSVYECPYCAGQSDVVLQVDSVSHHDGSREKTEESRTVYPASAPYELACRRLATTENSLASAIDHDVMKELLAGSGDSSPGASTPARSVELAKPSPNDAAAPTYRA